MLSYILEDKFGPMITLILIGSFCCHVCSTHGVLIKYMENSRGILILLFFFNEFFSSLLIDTEAVVREVECTLLGSRRDGIKTQIRPTSSPLNPVMLPEKEPHVRVLTWGMCERHLL